MVLRLEKLNLPDQDNIIEVYAPAKLNLFLHVTGKRSDGYHELESLVVFCGLHDRITLKKSNRLSLSCSGPYSGFIETDYNLCIKAAKYFESITNHSSTFDIHLEKNIPVAAGLGGGSSDAAAVLKGMAEFYNLNCPFSFGDVAMELGADVPVCLKNSAAFLTGAGEKIESANVARAFLVLVNPGRVCTTKEVFLRYHPPFDALLDFSSDISDYQSLSDYLKCCKNSLFFAAESLLPEIKHVCEVLSITEGCDLARMTGSGATCFGIFPDKNLALQAANLIKESHPEWWVFCTETI